MACDTMSNTMFESSDYYLKQHVRDKSCEKRVLSRISKHDSDVIYLMKKEFMYNMRLKLWESEKNFSDSTRVGH